MPPLNMLIKPASGICNMRCKYCFYHDVSENRSQASYGRMSMETLEDLVKRAFDFAEYTCSFAFQGGEPTFAGLEFFQRLTELEKKYNQKKVKVQYSIQTNGTLVDDRWAEFFARNHFLVGLSLDGTREVHDAMRVDAEGKGTFDRVMKTAAILEKYRVDFNILCVVNRGVAQESKKIYQFFREKKFGYVQPIPCLDPIGEQPGQHEFSLTPEKYGYFLKTFFDLWYDDLKNGHMTVIRNFDNYIGILMGYQPEMCSMLGHCICQYVVEADGSVYPCDFYVLDEWKLGNIRDSSFWELGKSEKVREFIRLSQHVDEQCRACRWRQLCRGGCRRNREPFQNGKPVLNYYCSSYREFFEYAAPRLLEIKRQITGR